MAKKKILFFSTLNPFPFWAGSENLWYDFVLDPRVNNYFSITVVLADSPITREKAEALTKAGITVIFFKHFNTHFVDRNIYRIKDRISKRNVRTYPWYNQIIREKYDLVWFTVSTHGDLAEMSYATELCKKTHTRYWLLLQHGYEDFFINSEDELEKISNVVSGAKKIFFIADRNRLSLERAIGKKIENSFRLVNAIPAAKILQARSLAEKHPAGSSDKVRFFNLGRFAPKDKAQHLILEAFKDSHWNDRDWELSFIGVSGFGKWYLEKLVHYYGLPSHRIKMFNHTNDVFEKIVENDVLLMPSLSEGTPFAMLESMACGRPVLGTPVGGIPEIIVDQKTGWLSRTVDIVDIQIKLEEAWKAKGRWKQMGEEAMSFIEHFYNQEFSNILLKDYLIEDA